MEALENYSLLSRLFSTSLFSELIRLGHSRLLKEIWNSSQVLSEFSSESSFADVINFSYSILSKKYRNEYIYKNVLINKILLGTHSLKTSYMISELPVASCKADMVILNGTSTVYEIKTELDSLNRLERQICAYQKAFDRINVITTDKTNQIREIEKKLPQEVGILSLTSRGTIHTVRSPLSNINNIDKEVIFNILRKREYLSVIKKHHGTIPDVPNTQIYDVAKTIFCEYSTKELHADMVEVLKQRGTIMSSFIQDIPKPLKALAIKSNFSAKERQRCLDLLSYPIADLIV